MKREILTINTFKYLCELYNGYTDSKIQKYKKYVILRNVNTVNNISDDKDIFFIPYNIFEDIVNSKSNITDKYVFTINSNKESLANHFSNCYTDFNDLLTVDTFDFSIDKDGIIQAGIVTPLTTNDGSYVECLCDTLRIYHPFNKPDLNYIIYIDNFINGIHFHYLCNLSSNYKVNASEEIRLNNEIYSEYIDVEFPNLSFLFEKNNFNVDEVTTGYNVYFEDIYNNVRYEHNGKQSEILNNVPLSLLIHPYHYDYIDNTSDKIYTDLKLDNYINYMSFTINVTIYPYTYNENENIYMCDENYIYDTNSFVYDKKFTLVSTFNFDKEYNHELILKNEFSYPGKERGVTLQQAYALYNGLTVYYDNKKEKWICKDYKNIEKYINKELDVDENNQILCCGFKIEIAIDNLFKNIIFTDYGEFDYIEDFAFSLSNIIPKWESLPNTLLLRVTFIDKYLGMSISSNFNIIPKEYIKYIISHNNNDTKRINIRDKQNMGWNVINANPDEGSTYFNFLNSVNVVVTKKDDTVTEIKQQNKPYVLYKPIFYRTNELNNVYFKKNLKQKIGINLANYMTKITMFKLIIEDKEYTEYARNDIYVIFDIYSGDIQNTAGVYNIVDSDNNFISDGKYIIKE